MRTLLIVALLLLFALPVAAQSIDFAWDPHPEASQLTGFKLYQTKTAGTYDMAAPVATFLGGTLTTGNIAKPPIGKYCWILTAYKEQLPDILESGPSNEVCDKILPKSPGGLKKILTTALTAPVKAVEKVAELVKGKKQLRIE